MKGILIDCYKEKDKIVLWIKSKGKDIRVEDSFTPRIYIGGDDLGRVRKKLFSKCITSKFVRKRSFYLGKLMWVLEIPVCISKYHWIIRYIEKLLDYDIELYNADLKLEEYYMFEKGLFPLAKVDVNVCGGCVVSIKALDDSESINYDIPKFKVGKLSVKLNDNLFKNFNSRLLGLSYNSKTYKGLEKDILMDFKKNFEADDPDILWVENGNMILPYLVKKFEGYGICFKFNRFDDTEDISLKEGDYFTSYSKVIYRTNSIFLKGRLHFDTRTFFADDLGYFGIMDGSRLCRQRIQRTEMRSAGAAVTNLLVYTAFKNGFLLPYKVGMFERFKTLLELYEGDRGSVIYEPRVGFHNDVAEFDFVSLYPNIMNKYNLSPESLFCKCCKWNKVPGLSYHYCTKERGVVSIVAEKLISRRILLKARDGYVDKQKVDFIKWLLVTMFGYQAFKNRKIGIIESHESIQAYAREILMSATRVAEGFGFEIVHGIIDSIYVKKKDFLDSEVEKLGNEIFCSTKMEVKHEGSYRWIVFLPSLLNSEVPVSNRFYGVFRDGEIKCRGIELRRRDTPKIIVDMQQEIIEILAKASGLDEFKGLFGSVFLVLKKYVDSLKYVGGEDLAFFKSISKTDYKNDIAQKVIIDKMKKMGYEIYPGQTIAYVISDFNNIYASRRYVPLECYNGRFDFLKYKELLCRGVFSLLQPFGVTMAGLFEIVRGERQMMVEDYGKVLNIKELKVIKKDG